MSKLIAWICLGCKIPIIVPCFIFGALAAEGFIWTRAGWSWAWRTVDDLVKETTNE